MKKRHMMVSLSALAIFSVVSSSAISQDRNRSTDDFEIVPIEIKGKYKPGPVSSKDDFEFGPIEIIKGVEPMSDARKMWMEYGDYEESLAADKEIAWAERKAMAVQGYIVSQDESIRMHNYNVQQPGQSSYPDIRTLLAYDPVALHVGLNVVGVIPDEVLEDGLVHDTKVVLDHPTLGLVFVRERSLATEPRATSKYIYAPKFDMTVNGNPALLSVMKSRDGKIGRTVLAILTDTQLLYLSAGKALLKDDPLYRDFMELAAKL